MVCYHKLGTPQSRDAVVYEDRQNPLRYHGADLTEDQRFMAIISSEGTSGSDLKLRDLSKGLDSELKVAISHFENDHYLVGNDGERLFIYTNLDAPNYRLVETDMTDPTPSNWVDVIPEQRDMVLNGVSMVGGRLFANYMKDASTRIKVFDVNGKFLNDVELPGIGTASGFRGRMEHTETFYTFTSFTVPAEIYRYDIATNTSTLIRKSEVNFDPSDYETKQVWYDSKDGTRIPMFVVHKKGLKLDGSNPTYLYGYGGFNISLTPAFSIARIAWLEQGGVYAQPTLRGGGEYGEEWHKAGMLLNKQNVFDDFIAAAEYLIHENYTSSEKLAISGRSNGGLLVGATMTQRPELCAVALPGVGVMDMLRYHKFTVGHGWVVEYGSSDDKADFENLLAYSPLHNIDEASYPATLVTTADHDDRVVPAHSFKFISELQRKQQGHKPVLIRIDVKAGHGAGKPTAMIIDEWADLWAFTLWNLGVKELTH
jgi:prolyl oligopeptidase